MQPYLHAQTLTHMIKTTSSRLFPLLFIGMTLAFASCSEDSNDPKYTSRCPRFSDVTCRSLSGGTVLQAGQPIVVTAVQRSQGKLLNGTTYEWSCEINDSTTHKKNKDSYTTTTSLTHVTRSSSTNQVNTPFVLRRNTKSADFMTAQSERRSSAEVKSATPLPRSTTLPA